MSPLVPQVLRIAPHTFVLGVGVIEIVAGLLTISAYFDVALRDLGLALGAFALARLAQDTEVTGRARRLNLSRPGTSTQPGSTLSSIQMLSGAGICSWLFDGLTD